MVSKEQLKTLLESIEKETGLGQEAISLEVGYAATTLTELLSGRKRLDSAYKRLNLKYGDRLNNSTQVKAGGAQGSGQHFTADQLFAMYMKAMERQDGLMEAQTVILKNIESKMARLDSQTIIKQRVEKLDTRTESMVASLTHILTGLENTFRFQERSMEELRDFLLQLLPGKNVASPDADKKPDQNDGGGNNKNRIIE